MAVKIRLKRTGTRNKSCFRIVVMDVRSARDGRAIEELGFYDPRGKQEKVALDRVEYWTGVGAAVSETVAAIIDRAKNGKSLKDTVKPQALSKKAQAKAKAEAEAKAKAEAEAAAAAAPEA